MTGTTSGYMRPCLFLTAIFSFSTLLPSLAFAQENYVPYVSCKSDGQMGPAPGYAGNPKAVKLDKETAAKLAYYQGNLTEGVLAPRGWHCFGLYGSSGSTLLVTPEEHADIAYARPMKGPAVAINSGSSNTGGRFSVAKVVARVFPEHKDYVERVIAEGIEPASNFSFAPFPDDKLNYLSKEKVEFETPPHKDGLGTGWLSPDDLAIIGVTMLVDSDFDLVSVQARLPQDMSGLAAAIVRQAEVGQDFATLPRTGNRTSTH